MPNTTVPAAAIGLPQAAEAHGRIPAGARADVFPADRRTFLRQLVAASALALPVAAAAAAHADADDPIFAAIERHRRLEAEFSRVCGITDEVAAAEEGRTITAADEQVYERVSDAADTGLDALVETVPVTVAGVRAMLAYVFGADLLEDEVRDCCIESVLQSPVLAGGVHAKA